MHGQNTLAYFGQVSTTKKKNFFKICQQSKLFESESSAEVAKIRDIFESESNVCDEVDNTKACYEWKYKKKSITELQKFMASHGNLVPASISRPLVEVEKNLAFVPARSNGYKTGGFSVTDYGTQ